MRQQRRWLWISVAAFAAFTAGCAVEQEPTSIAHRAAASTHGGEQQRTIVGGLRSQTDPSVVALLNRGQQFCTGTVIAETIVLTAAHCLPPHNPLDLSDVTVFIGPDTSEVGVDIAVADALAHPMWQRDLLGYDVGLVRLAQAAPVAPLPLLTRAFADLDRDVPLRLVGYGTTERGGRDHGVQYSGAASAGESDAFSIYVNAGPAITCSGDSGGPALIERDGRELIAGVHSRSDCTSEAVEEVVSIHLDNFIEPYASRVGQCPPAQGCAPPCAGDACEVRCERTGDCARPPSSYRPSDNAGGCHATPSSGSRTGALACALVALTFAWRRRRAT